ncbi:tonB-system energizer ExbB [Alcanivorax sp. S71-1-4]|nr:tonB-system energizer ExbB [Alcanivorax sp. S71-1-4]
MHIIVCPLMRAMLYGKRTMKTFGVLMIALLCSGLLLPAQAQESTSSAATLAAPDAMPLADVDAPAAPDAQEEPAMQDTQEAPAGAAPVMAHDLSPWGMYQAADWVVKAVMIGLLLASVLTWTVWAFKTVQLRLARRRAARLLDILIAADNFAQADEACAAGQGAGMHLLQATRHELTLSARGPASDDGIKERVAARLERVQAAASAQINRGTGVLASIGAVAPFVGLFGTVWGIMNSFIGIARTQTTNLAVVAPGIAEALLATAIGLVAAIPAVIIYNHFSRSIGGYRALLADIAVALLTLVSRDLDRRRPDARPVTLVEEGEHTVLAMARGGH